MVCCFYAFFGYPERRIAKMLFFLALLLNGHRVSEASRAITTCKSIKMGTIFQEGKEWGREQL